MMIRPKALGTLVAAALLICFSAAYAQRHIVVTQRVLAQHGRGWDFTFRYPALVGGLQSREYNRRTADIAGQALRSFRKDQTDFGPPSANQKNLKSVLDAKYHVLCHGDIVSVKWDAYQMMAGAAHPITQVITSNWLASGHFLTMHDLFQPHSHWLETISGLAKTDLERQARKQGFDLISPAGVAPDPKNFAAFGITKGGLKLFFQYGQVAPGYADNLTTTIPWSELKAALEPEIFKIILRL